MQHSIPESHIKAIPRFLEDSTRKFGLMASTTSVLPPELMELQVAQMGLLLAMYPDDIVFDGTAEESMASLRSYCNNDIQGKDKPPLPPSWSITIKLEISRSKRIQIEVSIPVQFEQREGEDMPLEPPYPKTKLKQPPWLSKAQVSTINAEVPPTEDLFTQIDLIKDAAEIEAVRSQEERKATASVSKNSSGPLVRVWFYFPSISTREKRDDLINNAPHYDLTGFLLAGKPGILCLEGTSKSIDDYMKFIKTESWGDIPAHHKKVSERHREESKGGYRGEDDIKRRFEGMTEVTDNVGERRGERGNRTDMKALVQWLKQRGSEGILEKIVM